MGQPVGTIAVRTTCGKSAQEVYGLLKSRMDIEKAFDIFKNILESDKNYMRDDKQLESFLFVSFIVLQFYYRIYGKLIEKELLNYYSVPDVIEYLKRVHLITPRICTNFKLLNTRKIDLFMLRPLHEKHADKD